MSACCILWNTSRAFILRYSAKLLTQNIVKLRIFLSITIKFMANNMPSCWFVAAKVVIFFEICNKLGGNVVFFKLSAEFVYTEWRFIGCHNIQENRLWGRFSVVNLNKLNYLITLSKQLTKLNMQLTKSNMELIKSGMQLFD